MSKWLEQMTAQLCMEDIETLEKWASEAQTLITRIEAEQKRRDDEHRKRVIKNARNAIAELFDNDLTLVVKYNRDDEEPIYVDFCDTPHVSILFEDKQSHVVLDKWAIQDW